MIPVYLPAQIRNIDSIAVERYGMNSLVLMENAAVNIKNVFLEIIGNQEEVYAGIICGKGNNGGDGYCLARHLVNEGVDVTVLSLFPPEQLSSDSRANYNILTVMAKKKNVTMLRYRSAKDIQKLKHVDFLFDCILGSGAIGDLQEPVLSVVKTLNYINAVKIAVDIPTGLNAETGYAGEAFEADFTITLGGLKQGLFINSAKRLTGVIYEAGIGTPDEIVSDMQPKGFLISPEDVLRHLPKRKKDLHKYSAGKVTHLTGSYRYQGAGLLTSTASFYAGAGASILLAGSSYSGSLHQEAEHQLVILKYDDSLHPGHFGSDNIKEIKSVIKNCDVIVAGSGIDTDLITGEAISALLKEYPDKLKVLDADALSFFDSDSLRKYNLKNAILTPHIGEFARLLKVEPAEIRKNYIALGSEFTARHKCHLLLKDACSVIFTPDGRYLINTTGNNGLAKFGSGDVLAGIIGAILAQSKNIESALICSVYLHGLTADILEAETTEFGYTAMQLTHHFPYSIKFLRNSFAELS